MTDLLRRLSSAGFHIELTGDGDLIKTRSRMLKRPPGSAIEQEFTKRLHLWADLDDTLRDVYPMYRGCPVGGCHESAPVRCRSCCEGANT